MTEASDSTAQLRPGLWDTINERYPGSMITRDEPVPLAPLPRPIGECRVAFVSTAGVHAPGDLPLDVVHPIGDFTYRRVPTDADVDTLEIHHLKYPVHGAQRDLNVVFPLERLRELHDEGVIGPLTDNFYTVLGYNMDPLGVEERLAEDVAAALAAERADLALLAPA